MYEAKYSKYITKNDARFAEPEEIKECCEAIYKSKESKGCGAFLYYENKVMYVDNSDAHYFIKGGTGSKKSRVQGVNIINSIINAGENAVINDPKGEMYKKTAAFANAKGYNILVFNLRDVTKSSGWNPLSLPYDLYMENNIPEAEQSLDDLTEAIIGPAKEKVADVYWPEMAGSIFNYSSKILADSVPKELFNMSNVIQLTHESNADVLRRILNSMDQNSSAAISMHGVLDLVAEKTSSCIYSSLKASLKPFIQNKSLLDLLCRNDIDFSDLVTKKTVIYVIYPDEKTSLCFLINLFFTQCYQYLISLSAKTEDGRLQKRVNFVLDEFSNLPAIENFENRISEARGHNIRYFLFCQSFGQLKNKYKENADTIIANCDWIVFPSKEIDFLEKISRMCGKRFDYRGKERSLVSVCDIQHMKKFTDGAEILILKSGQYPFITKIPDYEYLHTFGKCSEAKMNEIRSENKPVFISFEDWVDGIGEIYNFPFPKEKRDVDRRKVINNKKNISFTDEKLKDELKRKFEELFGSVEDE